MYNILLQQGADPCFAKKMLDVITMGNINDDDETPQKFLQKLSQLTEEDISKILPFPWEEEELGYDSNNMSHEERKALHDKRWDELTSDGYRQKEAWSVMRYEGSWYDDSEELDYNECDEYDDI